MENLTKSSILFVIAIYFDNNVEYWFNDSDITTSLLDDAKKFESEVDAKEFLNNTVLPYAEAEGWNVDFKVIGKEF